jgi:hypothetical protein
MIVLFRLWRTIYWIPEIPRTSLNGIFVGVNWKSAGIVKCTRIHRIGNAMIDRAKGTIALIRISQRVTALIGMNSGIILPANVGFFSLLSITRLFRRGRYGGECPETGRWERFAVEE